MILKKHDQHQNKEKKRDNKQAEAQQYGWEEETPNCNSYNT